MKYRVTLNGREREVDVVLAAGTLSVKVDDLPVEVDAHPIAGGVSMRFGAQVREVLVSDLGADEYQVASGPARGVLTLLSERAASDRRRAGGASAATELRAPMPGRIVKILAKPGEAVHRNQPLIVIEAMKMENELRAPADATIAQIHVVEGVNVESRHVLITFAS